VQNELHFKKIKVSQKGQVAIPADIQRRMGLKNGDDLLLITKGKKLLLEKPDKVVAQLKGNLLMLLFKIKNPGYSKKHLNKRFL
jgi:AbrB family looped-hinge helix DNA binding protein